MSRSASTVAAAALVALAGACGPASRGADTSRAPVSLSLLPADLRFELQAQVGDDAGAGSATLRARAAAGGELLCELRLDSAGERGPLAGLAGVTFRFRMSDHGEVRAGGGPAAGPEVGAPALARALALWPLLLAALPRLPDHVVDEGARWDARQQSHVVGGGHELVVETQGEWRLAKILRERPATAVLEAELLVIARDPLAPAPAPAAAAGEDAPAAPAAAPAAASERRVRVTAYLNLDAGAVDFVTVSGDGVSWYARRR